MSRGTNKNEEFCDNIKIINDQKKNNGLYKNIYYVCHLVSIFLEKVLTFYYEIHVISKPQLEISFCKDFI